MTTTNSAESVASPERFGFGENWSSFLSEVDETRIAEAEASLKDMLEVENLEGKRFLDIGSGSGLFSLAAVRLGAAAVHSFDYDPDSVSATQEMKRRHADGHPGWTVERGSALDADYLRGLGTFDIVYSWGVLHHTGNMALGLENAALPVTPGGQLFIAIYNDEGRRSTRWRAVKRKYNELPEAVRPAYVALVMAPFEIRLALRGVLSGDPKRYARAWKDYKQSRGMSRWHDLVDWVGGYPFEVAKPEEILDFYRPRGLELERLVTRCGWGCNEFVFRRRSTARD